MTQHTSLELDWLHARRRRKGRRSGAHKDTILALIESTPDIAAEELRHALVTCRRTFIQRRLEPRRVFGPLPNVGPPEGRVFRALSCRRAGCADRSHEGN